MTAVGYAGAPLGRKRQVRPWPVQKPNRKAWCGESRMPRLERGKGCKALPIATGAPAVGLFGLFHGRRGRPLILVVRLQGHREFSPGSEAYEWALNESGLRVGRGRYHKALWWERVCDRLGSARGNRIWRA